MAEEFTNLRKSKPVLLVAGVIWILIADYCNRNGVSQVATEALERNLLEYCELLLFLLVAMTYVATLQERRVFDVLRCWLVSRGFSLRALFWITGFLAFFISPFADNLTTALVMGAVIIAVGGSNKKFISIACINIVVAANAGGAFSPFGDITTLMVWHKGVLHFEEFFYIFVPSLVSFIVPAAIMNFTIPNEKPVLVDEDVQIKPGGITAIFLFLLTLLMAIVFHQRLHLSSAAGMMMGLSYLMFLGFYLKNHESKQPGKEGGEAFRPFDIFNKIERAEWDTLLFFYGVILSVGGLATLGYLAIVSEDLYQHIGSNLPAIYQATPANFIVGILSAIVDNIPVMYAVLTMNPAMSDGQWLLVTLTAGIGGSLLSIGSAAGVALMGQSKGYYTFFTHLKWTWAIFIGDVLGVIVHLLLNHHLFLMNTQ